MLGTYLAIDAMMRIFSGRSYKTHIINNKPAREGYKWFVLIEYITLYIVNFTPDGIMVGKDKKLSDEIYDKGFGNIISTIKFLIQPLVENMKKVSERNCFVIETENHFTFPRVMAMLQEYMI